MSAISESGESFSCNALFRVHPLSSQGQIALENVRMAKYSPYIKDRYAFTIVDGAASVRLSYDVDLLPRIWWCVSAMARWRCILSR